MAGHGDKLSRKQELAIAALLTEATIDKAAVAAGVSTRTLKNWLADPHFKSAYREARREILEAVIGRLTYAANYATTCLMKAMTCGHAGTEVKAAVAILGMAVKAAELMDLAERLEVLEAAAAAAAEREGR